MNKLRNEKLNYFELKTLKKYIRLNIEFRSFAATQGYKISPYIQKQLNVMHIMHQDELITLINELIRIGINPFYNFFLGGE